MVDLFHIRGSDGRPMATLDWPNMCCICGASPAASIKELTNSQRGTGTVTTYTVRIPVCPLHWKTSVPSVGFTASAGVINLAVPSPQFAVALLRTGTWSVATNADERGSGDQSRLFGANRKRESLQAGATDSEALASPGEAVLGAAKRGDAAALRALAQAGADLNAKDKAQGWTPLMFAIEQGHSDAVTFLIEAGADVNSPAETGTTALMVAVVKARGQMVGRLLQAHVDTTARDTNGRTALDLANLKLRLLSPDGDGDLEAIRDSLSRSVAKPSSQPTPSDAVILVQKVLTDESGSPKDQLRPILEELRMGGDDSVPLVERSVRSCATGGFAGSRWWDNAPLLCELLAAIGTPAAAGALVAIANTDSYIAEFDTVRAAAARRLGTFRALAALLIPELETASKLPHAPTLALADSIEALGGVPELTPNLIIERCRSKSRGQLGGPVEAIKYFAVYQEKALGWGKDDRRYFFHSFGSMVAAAFRNSPDERDRSRVDEVARPYFAAAVLADQEGDWSSLPTVAEKTLATARQLAAQYPLPARPPLPTSHSADAEA